MNYDRYRDSNEQKYNKKTFSYYLMRQPVDKILIPYVSGISHKKVLEVGIGYGYYTKYYINNNNQITGLDANAQMGVNIGVKVIQGFANQLKEKICDKYQCILSFWMTEYLSYTELKAFIEQGIEMTEEGGIFATTIILKKGLGRFYIDMASLRGVKKYNYTLEQVENIVGNQYRKRITPLNSVCGIPFAILLEVEKSNEKR